MQTLKHCNGQNILGRNPVVTLSEPLFHTTANLPDVNIQNSLFHCVPFRCLRVNAFDLACIMKMNLVNAKLKTPLKLVS